MLAGPFYSRCLKILEGFAELSPGQLTIEKHEQGSRDEFRSFWFEKRKVGALVVGSKKRKKEERSNCSCGTRLDARVYYYILHITDEPYVVYFDTFM